MVLRALRKHGVHKLIRLRNVEARVTSGICHSSLSEFFVRGAVKRVKVMETEKENIGGSLEFF